MIQSRLSPEQVLWHNPPRTPCKVSHCSHVFLKPDLNIDILSNYFCGSLMLVDFSQVASFGWDCLLSRRRLNIAVNETENCGEMGRFSHPYIYTLPPCDVIFVKSVFILFLDDFPCNLFFALIYYVSRPLVWHLLKCDIWALSY